MSNRIATIHKLKGETSELHRENARLQKESRQLTDEILGFALNREFERLPDLVDKYWELYDARHANYKAIENRVAKIKELRSV